MNNDLFYYEQELDRDYKARELGYEDWEDYKESDEKLEERLEL